MEMKAQISLEFMVVVAIYLAFILAILHSQGAIIQGLKGNATAVKQSFDADSTNARFFLGRLYASEGMGPINYKLDTGCRLIGNFIFCGTEDNVTRKISYMNDSYADILG